MSSMDINATTTAITSPALGPHPQRELTLMRHRWLRMATGAAWPQALLHLRKFRGLT
jgi:hypothetical protein